MERGRRDERGNNPKTEKGLRFWHSAHGAGLFRSQAG